MVAAVARGFSGIVRAAQIGGQIVLAFMVITICYDAIMRYVFTAPTSWSLEINTFLIVYVALMTAADVQRTKDHIAISFFSDAMGPWVQRAGQALIGVAGMGFCGIMAWRGVLITAQSWEYGERVSSSFGTYMVFPYALLPLGFTMLGLQFFADLMNAITGAAGKAARN
ncbi:TRAP transporter small permease [Sulfitobacter sp.]|uniref:TRAP transporter small permease n=1 Tax=Sulfitobacter sp. TaxID=1903071 RepID=UPI002626DED4|nr:TRAP transporter small permease [Sulfitobacter sp.]|tara:strand:+ start:8693 stop:9199 length:507 start_codon:yes stop_codon:yes gene_type:complete